jgi:hypothetical protein
MAKTKKTKRMPIEDMPNELLNEERAPVDFDALMDKAICVELKERCNKCPCMTLVTMKQTDLFLQTSKMPYAMPFYIGMKCALNRSNGILRCFS